MTTLQPYINVFWLQHTNVFSQKRSGCGIVATATDLNTLRLHGRAVLEAEFVMDAEFFMGAEFVMEAMNSYPSSDLPRRAVYCEDAISWLNSSQLMQDSSLVASLPDFSEFPLLCPDEWKEWFRSTALLLLSRTPDDGVTIFYQSDIKLAGTWVSKVELCLNAAALSGHQLLWHKIACRAPAGSATFGRPAYSHVICFSKSLRLNVADSTPDVMPEVGDKSWSRGMGLEVCLSIGRFIAEQVKSRTIIQPFCGQGGMLAVANELGLDAIGIERNKKCAEVAMTIKVDLKAKNWIKASNLRKSDGSAQVVPKGD